MLKAASPGGTRGRRRASLRDCSAELDLLKCQTRVTLKYTERNDHQSAPLPTILWGHTGYRVDLLKTPDQV